MSQPAQKILYTRAEFAAMEEKSDVKHEWLNGEVFAMAGGTPDHARLASRVISALGAQLKNQPCEVFTSDLMVSVRATGLMTYPDATVICGRIEQDPEDKNAITNPKVIVEVLSDSTELRDRTEKLAHYQRIPSLKEYVLVSQRKRSIEVYRRGENREWLYSRAVEGEAMPITSIDCELIVDEIYRNALESSA